MTLHRQSAIPEGPGDAVAGSRKDLEKLLQDRYAAYAAVTEVKFGSPIAWQRVTGDPGRFQRCPSGLRSIRATTPR